MGTFSKAIEVLDMARTRSTEVEALVDTGASFPMLPRDTLQRICVVANRRARFRLADERSVQRDMTNVVIRIDGQEAITFVIFGEPGQGAILGAYTLEGLLLAVDPVRRRLVPVEGLLK